MWERMRTSSVEKMAIREVCGDQNEFDMLILYLGFQVNRRLEN